MGIKIILEDGFAIEKGTGIGRSTLNLFQQLRKLPEVDSIHLIEKSFLNKVPSVALRRALYVAWLNSGLQLLLKRRKVDVIHFTNYLIPALKLSDTKYAVTIYDLTAWRFPETLPFTYLPYIKQATFHAVKTADLILTISDAVKKEIIELFKVDGERIHTVYTGIPKYFWQHPKKVPDEIVAIKDKFGIKKEFLLFVGTIEERKNVMTLIRAFEMVRNWKNLQLVLVGRPGYGFSKLSKYLDDHQLKGEVILTGYIAEEELIALYDMATAFTYPSLYEGFGIPLVEAMARGVPIVASKIPSTEEVVGEAAIYYNDAFDHEALTKLILELLENDTLRRDLVEKGMERSQQFSWDRIGKRYIKTYQKLLKV